MQLQIQDPNFPLAASLHEELLKACDKATSGGGAFAFVTSGGIELYLEDQTFLEFVKLGEFELVVGLDDITNVKALRKLNELSNKYPNLKVSAFLHTIKTSLFHPKFCWFKSKNGGKLIIGSGNLTTKALRRNWESFTVIDLNSEQLLNVERSWSEWLHFNRNWIKSIDEDDVLQRAKENKLTIRKTKKGRKIVITKSFRGVEEESEEAGAWQFEDLNSVLIAEIPKSGNRWNQANFDLNTFQNFFGAIPGDNSHRVVLRNINGNGKAGEIEVRPSVSVVSQNYRFELDAAKGLVYPDRGRPIGVFIRISTRMFLYILAMPGNFYYDDISNLLSEKYSGRKDRVKRVIVLVSELKKYCHNLPFWKLKIN